MLTSSNDKNVMENYFLKRKANSRSHNNKLNILDIDNFDNFYKFDRFDKDGKIDKIDKDRNILIDQNNNCLLKLEEYYHCSVDYCSGMEKYYFLV